MKTLYTTLIILICLNVNAQSSEVSIMAGHKAAEVSFMADFESELSFGVAISATAADVTEKRANKNDLGKIHVFKGDLTPAAFALAGAKFDDLKIIGKVGVSYVEQTINGEPTEDVFLALGLAAEYNITETLAFRASYDSVAGVMAGITIHFNRN